MAARFYICRRHDGRERLIFASSPEEAAEDFTEALAWANPMWINGSKVYVDDQMFRVYQVTLGDFIAVRGTQ